MVPPQSAAMQLLQKLIGWNEEGVLLQYPAHNHHGVSPKDVHDYMPTKLGEIIRSHYRVAVFRKDIVQPRLVFEQVIDPGPVLQCPLHVSQEPSACVTLRIPALEYFFDQAQHRILIEVSAAQIRLFPNSNLQLATGLACGYINSSRFQTARVLRPELRINNMERLFRVSNTFRKKWKQNFVLLVRVVEERADVARHFQSGPREMDRAFSRHSDSLPGTSVLDVLQT